MSLVVFERKGKLMLKLVMSRVMRSVRNSIVEEMNIVLEGRMLEKVEVFNHQGLQVTSKGGIEKEVQQRVLEGSKILGTVRSVLKGTTMILG